MGETLRNAWRVPELRKKLIYTFLMLLLYRLVGVVPVPGINLASIQASIANYDALGLRKIGQSVIREDNPCVRGQIFTVKHMVKVEEIED